MGQGNEVVGVETLVAYLIESSKNRIGGYSELWLGAVAAHYSPWLDLASRRGLMPPEVLTEVKDVLSICGLTYEDLECYLLK